MKTLHVHQKENVSDLYYLASIPVVCAAPSSAAQQAASKALKTWLMSVFGSDSKRSMAGKRASIYSEKSAESSYALPTSASSGILYHGSITEFTFSIFHDGFNT